MRYGILGGSFDPIHLGHVSAAEAALRQRALAAVLLIPAGQAPHKRPCEATFADRLAMARIAVRGRAGLEVLDLEGARPGPSYTVVTVEALRRQRPEAAFELLVGADMLADLPQWHRAHDLVGSVTVVAFGRPGAPTEAAREAFEAAFGPDRVSWLDLEPVRVSSTEVRRKLASGEPLRGLLDPAVEAFVREKGLYGTGGARGAGKTLGMGG